MKACINYEICKCRPDLKAFCDKVKDAMEESWNMGAKVSTNSISTAQDVLGEAMQPIIAELTTLKAENGILKDKVAFLKGKIEGMKSTVENERDMAGQG